jgi:hypothetical protein
LSERDLSDGVWRRAVSAFASNRLDVAAAVAVASLLVTSHVVLPRTGLSPETVRVLTYAASLVAFCVWMVWFVATGARVWRTFGE